MSEIFLRKYGVEATIDFSLYEVDGVNFRIDAVHAAGDTTLMKDEATEASTTNGFTDEGKGYSIVLTATEMQAARIVIYVVDLTATKVWLDRTIIIETYGHASAQHAFDLDDSSIQVARGEPGQGAPPVNPDMATKIDYLYKFLRNKITNDGTDIEVYDDAGTTVDHKAPVSKIVDTVTRGEFITGP